MEITRGKVKRGVKFLVYGPEGIGKSTFVSNIPGIVFIDTEGSTGEMDVMRLPTPTSWQMLLSEVDYAVSHPEEIKALVIDTADWAERMCIDDVCAQKQMKSIEDAGYGKGYVYVYEEFGKLLNKMEVLSQRGVHAGFTAHAMMRKFEQPDEMGAYDRWELKMSKKVAPLVKEWSSLMLFANYETMVYATDKDGKKHKAAGGQRVMYAVHHPCWDAKNRYGLPEKMPFSFDQVAHVFTDKAAAEPIKVAKDVKQVVVTEPDELPVETVSVKTQQTVPPVERPQDAPPMASVPGPSNDPTYDGVPPALVDLMRQDGILPIEVKTAIAQRGYFPLETPFENYPEDFVKGVLIGAWAQVKNMCLQNRSETAF